MECAVPDPPFLNCPCISEHLSPGGLYSSALVSCKSSIIDHLWYPDGVFRIYLFLLSLEKKIITIQFIPPLNSFAGSYSSVH